ncbi:cell division protein FtsK [Candidatus Magnetoovum chiemensis]|nr:cell division protein FtsK [Candidatus Magnetoovum chiemensis]
MSKVYTNKDDETTIEKILSKNALGVPKKPKWYALRIALAISLSIDSEPDENIEKVGLHEKGSEYDLEQVVGKGQKIGDFHDPIRAILSIRNNKNMFEDEGLFISSLQRHIRRGLKEIRISYKETSDFHEYLYQELFAGTDNDNHSLSNNNQNIDALLLNALKEIDIKKTQIVDRKDGPRLTRFHIQLDEINDLDKLKKGMSKVSFSTGHKNLSLQQTDERKIVAIDVLREEDTWNTVTYKDLSKWIKDDNGHPLRLWIGVDILGKPYSLDLAEAPHILIGGTTGSGKSICMHSMLLSLLLNNKREDLKLCLIDPKKTELISYAKIPDFLYNKEIITDASNAIEVLDELSREMQSRMEMLGTRNIQDAKGKGIEIPYIAVFIDELASLIMEDEEVEKKIVSLVRMGRALGIHLILATQRPDAETLTGQLRSNVPSRIALTVQKSSESKIILDDKGAEVLSGKGDMLVKPIGKEITRVHGVYISNNDISNTIAQLIK